MGTVTNELQEKLDSIKRDIHHLVDCVEFIKHIAIENNSLTILGKVYEFESAIQQLFDKYLQLRTVIKRILESKARVEGEYE